MAHNYEGTPKSTISPEELAAENAAHDAMMERLRAMPDARPAGPRADSSAVAPEGTGPVDEPTAEVRTVSPPFSWDNSPTAAFPLVTPDGRGAKPAAEAAAPRRRHGRLARAFARLEGRTLDDGGAPDETPAAEEPAEPIAVDTSPEATPRSHRAPHGDRRARRRRQRSDSSEPATGAPREREYSMLRDPRNWGIAGLAAALTIRRGGFRGNETSKVYAMLPEGLKRAVAASNIGSIALLTGIAWTNFVRPVAGAYLSIVKGYGELPNSNSNPGKLHLLSQVSDLTQGQGSGNHSTLTADIPGVAEAPSGNKQYIDPSQIDALGANRIEKGEGWYHQFRQMGMSQEQAEAFLDKHGAELERRGLAYRMGDSWGMNLGSHPHHDKHGTYNDFSASDMKWFRDTATHDGLLPPVEAAPVDASTTGGDHSSVVSGGYDHSAADSTTSGGTGSETTTSGPAGPELVDSHAKGGDYNPRHGYDELTALGAEFIGLSATAASGVIVGREALKRARAAGLEPGRHRAPEEAVVAADAARRATDEAARRREEESAAGHPDSYRGRRRDRRGRHQGRREVRRPNNRPADRTSLRDRVLARLPRRRPGRHERGGRSRARA